MGRICEVTGKGTAFGNNVSHSHRKTRRKFKMNIIKKRIYLEDEQKWVKLSISTRTLRTLRKKGLKSLMADHGQSLKKKHYIHNKSILNQIKKKSKKK